MLFAFLLAGALLMGTVPAGAQPEPAEVQAKAREVLKGPRYQREMPTHREPTDLDDSRGRELLGGGGGVPAPVVMPALGAGAAIGQVVFIILIVVAVLLLAGWLGQAVVRRRRGAETVEVAAEEAAVREREPTFDEATRLAAEGRYAEAVHALLLAAIRHFAERSRVSIQPSRTSRELVRLLPLGAETREAFSDLVRTVELSLFGGAAVGQEEYERSLARFRDLTRRAA